MIEINTRIDISLPEVEMEASLLAMPLTKLEAASLDVIPSPVFSVVTRLFPSGPGPPMPRARLPPAPGHTHRHAPAPPLMIATPRVPEYTHWAPRTLEDGSLTRGRRSREL